MDDRVESSSAIRLSPAHRPIRWWIPLLAPLVIFNAFGLLRVTVNLLAAWDTSGTDWEVLTAAGALSNPFDVAAYRLSPVLAWAFAAIAPIGITAWRLAHIAALAGFLDRRAVVALLVTFPFWWDVLYGDVLVFVALAAWWARRGNNVATICWFILVVMMPRPLMVPLTAWLLWQRPETRAWFAVIAIALTVPVVVSGYGDEWLARLATTPGAEMLHQHNMSPSRLIGVAWIPVGVALAVMLTWQGRLGLASMAIQPYILPYYLVMLVLDLPQRSRESLVR